MTKAELRKQIEESFDVEGCELLLADGFEDACLGVIRSFNTLKVLYDYATCVRILMSRDGMTEEEAHEFLEVNTLGAYVGDGTPAYLMMRTAIAQLK